MRHLREKYKNVELIISFHRGIGEADKYTSESGVINTQKIADIASNIGCKVVDVFYDENKLNFYNECDLHVGYCVHTHIYVIA